MSSMLDREIKSVCKNYYDAPNALLHCRLSLNYSESVGGGAKGGQGQTAMLQKKCCNFDWFVFANGALPTFAPDVFCFGVPAVAAKRRNGWCEAGGMWRWSRWSCWSCWSRRSRSTFTILEGDGTDGVAGRRYCFHIIVVVSVLVLFIFHLISFRSVQSKQKREFEN